MVRKCTAQHLANLVDRVGAARLLSGGKDLTDRILPAVTKLAQDSSQEARYVETLFCCCCCMYFQLGFYKLHFHKLQTETVNICNHYYTGSTYRYFGRRMLLSLSSHPDFDKILEKYIPSKDLPTVRDTVFTLKTKVQCFFFLDVFTTFVFLLNVTLSSYLEIVGCYLGSW